MELLLDKIGTALDQRIGSARESVIDARLKRVLGAAMVVVLFYAVLRGLGK